MFQLKMITLLCLICLLLSIPVQSIDTNTNTNINTNSLNEIDDFKEYQVEIRFCAS